MTTYDLKNWLPTTKKEMEIRGWDSLDVILFSGDAYVDHPSFGIAVIGRLLEAQGLKIAIVPQPNWRDDLRDFKKLGKPNLFFGISAGCMDSMVNKYTANKRLRSDDAYTADGKAGMRPDMPTIVYTKILKELFPDVPVLIGGIEASLRRLTHYDYWEDRLRPSILVESGADILMYGMGEQPLRDLITRLKNGESISSIRDLRQTAVYIDTKDVPQDKEVVVEIFSHEECEKDKLKQAKNFRIIEEESNAGEARRILQNFENKVIVVNPPFPTMTTDEIDGSFDLPYTRLPHPKYKGKTIPAYEMIKFSVNLHRGCFGGCAFCTISAHQGKAIASRSQESVLREVKELVKMEGFKGYISDLGGPSANMYQMKGKDMSICQKCRRPSCISPSICKNLNADHRPLLEIYKAVDAVPGIKKSFIGSGIRYDLMLYRDKDEQRNKGAEEYTEELIKNHVSGRLKVAPEHTEDAVLKMMRKPSFALFEEFKKTFDRINDKHGLNQQLIPYFISSHPGCKEEDMAELAMDTRRLNFHLEQVQDFTPTPMTLATEIYYTGHHPYTMEKIFTAKTKTEKLAQRLFFFWYQKEYKSDIMNALRKMNRPDLVKKIFGEGGGKSAATRRR
jgi:uncharacterized radical SAM protein YgiQ